MASKSPRITLDHTDMQELSISACIHVTLAIEPLNLQKLKAIKLSVPSTISQHHAYPPSPKNLPHSPSASNHAAKTVLEASNLNNTSSHRKAKHRRRPPEHTKSLENRRVKGTHRQTGTRISRPQINYHDLLRPSAVKSKTKHRPN
jgi:hypothetical protein